MTARSTGDAH